MDVAELEALRLKQFPADILMACLLVNEGFLSAVMFFGSIRPHMQSRALVLWWLTMPGRVRDGASPVNARYSRMPKGEANIDRHLAKRSLSEREVSNLWKAVSGQMACTRFG